MLSPALDRNATGAPLKCEVSTSKPAMLPGAPSLIMHLEGFSLLTNPCALAGKGVSPVVGRVMSPGFPSTVERAVWAELSFQARRRLAASIQRFLRDETGRRYLDEEEMVRCSEKLVGDGCNLCTERYAGQLCSPLSVNP